MEKKGQIAIFIVIAIVVIAILYFGFVFFGNSSNTQSAQNNETTTSNSQSTQSSSGNSTPSGNVKEFTMTAKKYEFDPSTITVNEGDTVILHITSADVTHGFAIPTFGVSQNLPPGVEETVQFVADQKGTFTFFCNVYCGPGHSGMKGALIVN